MGRLLRDITSDELDAWATNIAAMHTLPKLVRRLLDATTPNRSTQVDMPADGGVRLHGWDGIVRAETQTGFCPSGLSFWELTVQADRAKFDRDYFKRAPDPANSGATYVAVTARRFPGKRDWLEDKKRLHHWSDVRLYDAEDLTIWLERAPSVAAWFAETVLGRPLDEVTDAETFLTRWHKRTQPPLPWELVLTDREQYSRTLLDWLDRGEPRVIHLSADRRDEAMLFVTATLAQSEQHSSWLARTLIVESRLAWRYLMRQKLQEPLLLLPSFEGFEVGEAAECAGFVIVPLGPALPVGGEMPRLPPIAWRSLAKALTAHGWDRGDAWRLAKWSDGKLAILQRHCGYVEQREWIKHTPAAERLAFILVGAWNPRNSPDREVVEGLGANPDNLDLLCAELANREDVPVKRDGVLWRWAARHDVWQYLRRELLSNESLLDRFEKIIIDVLSRPNPMRGLSQEEALAVELRGDLCEHSGLLREGLASALEGLTSSDDVPAVVGSGRARVRRIVKRLLAPAWQHWDDIGPLLQYLANADPDAFLTAAESSLDCGDEGIASAPNHADLFRALACLAWRDEFIGRIVHLLVGIATLADNDSTRNGPLDTLFQLLHPWSAQSQSSVVQRIDLIRAIFVRRPAVGWRLGMKILEDFNESVPRAASGEAFVLALPPAYAAQDISGETIAQMNAVVDMLAERAGDDGDLWKELLDRVVALAAYKDQMAPTLIRRCLDHLEEVKSDVRDPMGRLWAVLRARMQWLKEHGEIWSADFGSLDGLTAYFEPRDPVVRAAQLLETDPDRWQRWKEDAQSAARLGSIVEELRRNVQSGTWVALQRMTVLLSEPSHQTLGELLATTSYAEELEAPMLDALDAAPMSVVALSFLAERAKHHDPAWRQQVLRQLVEEHRIDQAALLANTWPPSAELWGILDQLHSNLAIAYWRNIRILPAGSSLDERERAISGMLAAGNIAGAVSVASWPNIDVSTDTVTRVLAAWCDVVDAGTARLPDQHSLTRLFEHLDKGGSLDNDLSLRLELQGFKHLGREPRQMFDVLATDPEFFATLVTWIYKPEGESDESTEAARNRAANARAVLEAWGDVPGRELSSEEREEYLFAWASQALTLTRANGRLVSGVLEVARVLARAPAASDDVWPCLAARRLLDDQHIQHLSRALRSAKLELGSGRFWSPHLGGSEERKLAAGFHRDVQAIQSDWPRTAAVLRALADAYEESAEQAERLASSLGYPRVNGA